MSAATDPIANSPADGTSAVKPTAPKTASVSTTPAAPVEQIDPVTGQLKPEFVPKPKWTAEQQAAL